MADFDLGSIQGSGATGFDSMLRREEHILRPHGHRTRVASLNDLRPFMRLSSDTLVHKSDRDLWALRKEGNGEYYIERLFDDNGEPLKF